MSVSALEGRVQELERQLAAQRRQLHDLAHPDGDVVATRKLPERVSFAKFVSLLPAAPGLFDRRVPGQFAAQVDEDVVQVSCPCGQAPTVALYGGSECACGRWFLNIGRRGVRVAFTPSAPGRALGPTSAKPPVRCGEASTPMDCDGDGGAARAGSGSS